MLDPTKRLALCERELGWIRAGIIFLSGVLVFWNIVAFFFATKDYVLGIIGILCATIFILLSELTKTYRKSAFFAGTHISTFILVLFIIVLKDKFSILTIDNFFYLGIYWLLAIGFVQCKKIDVLKDKIAREQVKGQVSIG